MFLALLALSQAVKPVVLDAVGDVMLDRYVGRHIDARGSGYALEKVRNEFAKADLVLANLECPLTTQPIQVEKRFPFRAKPSRVKALKGIGVVSLANNHTLDCGSAGLAETVRVLEKVGIASIGVGGKTWMPLIVRRNGLRIALFAYSDFPEKPSIPQYPNTPLISYFSSARMRERLALIRPQVDFVIVFAHWGIEGDFQPSDRQRKEAKEMADSGADLILGSHPHVLQPVERIGHAVVAYSMGNFIFDAPNAQQAETAIFEFRLARHRVIDWRLVPCQIKGARPIPTGPRISIRNLPPTSADWLPGSPHRCLRAALATTLICEVCRRGG
ncbi:MAG TPA: CapA family protein [Fimbriimonadaceae bacterium]|nr:CapA family protein [Fimbriimonadaceae bacterium]